MSIFGYLKERWDKEKAYRDVLRSEERAAYEKKRIEVARQIGQRKAQEPLRKYEAEQKRKSLGYSPFMGVQRMMTPPVKHNAPQQKRKVWSPVWGWRDE